MREETKGSMWANVVAVATVAGVVGLLYLPLIVH